MVRRPGFMIEVVSNTARTISGRPWFGSLNYIRLLNFVVVSPFNSPVYIYIYLKNN